MGSVLLLALAAAASAADATATACADYNADPSQLQALEAAATKGALDQAQKDCLEKNYTAAKVQTVKDKISRVELVNAYAYSTKSWAVLVKRHLDEVDRSDPDIAYLYAYYLFNTNHGTAAEVIKWTEVALDRRDIWVGDTYVSRVFGLMKLRAMAANALWAEAEDRRAHGATGEDIDVLRNNVKTYSREWLDFAKVAGRDTREGEELCLSAAAKPSACGLDADAGGGKK